MVGRAALNHGHDRAFGALRRNMIRNSLRQAFDEARLRVMLVVLLTALFWLGLFWIAADGFRHLASVVPLERTRVEIIETLFSVFFVSLMLMLVFSSGIILYGGLYRSRETNFLLTTPAGDDRVFLHKFQEAMLFSSWGFVLLGSPMLIAYGLVALAPWYFFVLVPMFVVAFVHIPGGIGAIGCMLLVYVFPRARRQTLAVVAGIAALILGWMLWTLVAGPRSDLLSAGWFQDLMARFRFSEQRLLPSWWLTTGLLEAAHGRWTESVLFLAVCVANALIVQLLAVRVAKRYLRTSYDRLVCGHTTRKRRGHSWVDSLVNASVRFLPAQTRLLIVKDARLFRRDPVQWSQFLIFFGLLGLYFLNVRQFRYDVNYQAWVNIIAFLNLAVVGLILATFTSRFVFPMVSLEGRRFWILGLLPLRRATILWGKFLFATIGAGVPAMLLVGVSDVMLRVDPLVGAVHASLCVVLAAGLAGISVGLGAAMPNLREESPSKIAAGFGGTLTLVLSTAFIAVVVLLAAVPCHLYFTRYQPGTLGFAAVDSVGTWFASGVVAAWLVGILATIVPLRIGMRSFAEMEF